jgi:hypothetical protein
MKRARSNRVKAAAECIGTLREGEQVFAVTEGQFSKLDALLHVLQQTGPAHLMVWCWTIAEHDIAEIERLHDEGALIGANLLVDEGFRSTRIYGLRAVREWTVRFGEGSVKLAKNHAKMMLVASPTHRVVMRSSMNPNLNSRFENIDIATCPAQHAFYQAAFDAMPALDIDATPAAVREATQVGPTPNLRSIPAFKNLRRFSI